jgi:two-component system NtrC family sensor kinase
MQVVDRMSINRKLTLLVAVSVAVALSLSCVAFVINDIRFMRNSMVRQLSALADVLGSNTTAALQFDDSDTAEQILGSLRMQPMVQSAYIYDIDGALFAKYSRGKSPSMAPDVPHYVGHRFTHGGYLDVSESITANGEAIGKIYLRATLDLIYEEMVSYAVIVGFVMVVSFVAAYVLASRLQLAISRPILALADTAQRISTEQDYSIRVQKTSSDELGTLYDEFNYMLEQIETSKQALVEAHSKLEMRVEERTRQLSEANKELSREVTERRRAEKELEQVHRELVASARRAGMAEIATGVLHNVGNVLNSVNVSAAMLASRLKSSKRSHLNRVVAMLDEHRSDLDKFLTTDAKGKQIPDFLKALADHLQTEEEAMVEETRSLTTDVEHIKTIVATQQSYAGNSSMFEPTDINTLLDDAVRMNLTSFERHGIHVERNFADLPTVLADKQRLLQIVINLVKNAKEALTEQEIGRDRILRLETRAVDDRLMIAIGDTGVGIKKDDLTRIFSHGFTTKANGHGFGLHSCAIAATEMEGSLTAYSDGHMKGATFTLNLPLTPASVAT